MKEYEVIVIGSGTGLTIVDHAVRNHRKVALVAKEYPGDTCLNVGCIPSKMLLAVADRLEEIKESGKYGISAKVSSIDSTGLMARTEQSVKKEAERIRGNLKRTEHLDYYEAEGHFINEYTLEAGGEKIRGKELFIASGARPSIPAR
jgi:mycothione reductase